MGVEPLALEELLESWTLLGDELALVAGKRGGTRLGFALSLRYFTIHGRFPADGRAFGPEVVDFVGRQVGVDPSDLAAYGWSSRTAEFHRSQIRASLGFRECSVEDSADLIDWLAAEVCESERRPELVRG